MASKYLSPFSGRQFIDANGNPYSGAKLFTYVAGTTTKVTVYKDNQGSSSHANPIILNTRGEPADGAGAAMEIWQDGGNALVKYVLAPSTDTDPPVSAISTWDNIPGINDTASTNDQWQSGPEPTYISATSFTVAGDYSSTFHVGRRVKSTNSGGTRYSTITAVAYTTVTTVTVTNDSGSLDSGLSAVWYGIVASENSSLPGKIQHALTITQAITFTQASPLIFEGTTDDAYETALAITEPTADRTIKVQNQTGTISLCEPIIGTSKALVIRDNATNPNYQLDVAATAIVLHDSSNNALQLQTWSATADITASGANGLDTGAEANSTWYYVWAIYDGTNKRTLLSASATSPTMPSGYTYKALIGAVYNSSAGNFVPFRQYGKRYYYASRQSALSAGAATVETEVSCAQFVPAIAETFHGVIANQSNVGGTITLAFITATTYQVNSQGGEGGEDNECTFDMPNVARSFFYTSSGGTVTWNVYVNGFTLP